jgi:hypothetical protein
LISGLHAVLCKGMVIPQVSDGMPWRNQYSLVPWCLREIRYFALRVGENEFLNLVKVVRVALAYSCPAQDLVPGLVLDPVLLVHNDNSVKLEENLPAE